MRDRIPAADDTSVSQVARWRDRLAFALTNPAPRWAWSRLVARYSRIESVWLTRLTLRVWQCFADLRLDEAEARAFSSLRAFFVRRLEPGARPVDSDPGVRVSPCDAQVGEFGPIEGGRLLQAKGRAYALDELLGEPGANERFAGGYFVTLRLQSSMYHRFHAPDNGRLGRVDAIAGDRLNVNPVTLRTCARVFCRNERAVLPLELDRDGAAMTLVPVGAILVGSIRLHGLPSPLNPHRQALVTHGCDRRFARGDELGWFEHGSTIVVLVGSGLVPIAGLATGQVVRMGQPLFRRAAPSD